MTWRELASFMLAPAGRAAVAALAPATGGAGGENSPATRPTVLIGDDLLASSRKARTPPSRRIRPRSDSAPRSTLRWRRSSPRTTDSAPLDVDCRPAHGRAPLPLLRLQALDRPRDRGPRGFHDVHGDGLHHLRESRHPRIHRRAGTRGQGPPFTAH